ncbi:hypothetical protein ABWH91_02400 [Phycisphaerales bacterium ac7]
MNRTHQALRDFSITIGMIIGGFALVSGCASQKASENQTPTPAQKQSESDSSAKIVGVYPIEFSDEWLQKYWISIYEEDGYYDDMSDEERAEDIAYDAEIFRDNMEALHVIEIEADRPITRSDIDLFTQDAEKGMMSQVPYMEVWLDDAGQPIESDRLQPKETNRVAFYLHFVELDKPLYGAWGRMALPAPSDLPERLQQFIEYDRP